MKALSAFDSALHVSAAAAAVAALESEEEFDSATSFAGVIVGSGSR